MTHEHTDHGHAHGAAAGHGHHHHHHHAPADFGRAFAIGIALNLAYVLTEVACGVFAHSLSLFADAGHNLGDVLALAAAWVAQRLGRRQPSNRFTYGLRRCSILSALGNAIVLLVITGGIAWEAVRRMFEPAAVAGRLVIAAAFVGILINGATALLFARGRHGDVNLRGAFLHMASDAAMAAAVVLAGALIWCTGWRWIDPAVSLAVSVVIVAGTWSLLRHSLDLALDAVPPGIDRNAVESFLRELPGVTDLHDLHIWGMSTTETALTAHLVRPHLPTDDAWLRRAADDLRRRYGIGHATFQIEHGQDSAPPTSPPAQGLAGRGALALAGAV